MYRVYVRIGEDGAMLGPFEFGAMPRMGETLTMAQTSELSEVPLFEVQQVVHIAAGSMGAARFWKDTHAILQVTELD